MLQRRKALRWVGASYREIVTFPEKARRAAGYNLRLVQDGGMPDDWKVLDTVGPGVFELRVRTDPPAGAEYRVLYVARFEEAVYVLHGFEKKTRKTSQHNIDVGRARYAELLRTRREHGPQPPGA
jgi:phage-related protein